MSAREPTPPLDYLGQVDEEERLRRVYGEYARSPVARRRWHSANRGNQAIVAERVRLTAELLRAHLLLPLTGRRILDVGSGYGAELARMTTFGAEPELLTGIDLIEERVKQAQAAFPSLRFEVGNANQLPFPDGAFDLLMAFTLFSSILDEGMASRVAGRDGANPKTRRGHSLV